MNQLVALDSKTHRGCRVSEGATLRFAARQNVMQIQASEIGQAACSFPVFLTRGPRSGIWALSVVLGLEQGSNLFVQNEQWTAAYLPFGMQTYPLFLMKSPTDEKGFAVGVVGHEGVLSQEKGEALFDESGNESAYLSGMTKLLKANLENDAQSRMFAQRLEELDLIKAVDVKVHYEDGSVQTIAGLNTIDEDKLRSLAADTLEGLNRNGVLFLIHAMLVSVFQLNTLIRKHNQDPGRKPVKEAQLELSRPVAATD